MTDSFNPGTRMKTLLILGGSFTAAMAAFHFFLPLVADWSVEVKSIHPTVRWALFSLNFFFSFLLLALGAATIAGVVAKRTDELMYSVIVLTGAIFWLINGSYQLVLPMPMPARLFPLSLTLKSFAFGVALLHLIPLVKLARRKRKTAP